jgi:chromate transporter
VDDLHAGKELHARIYYFENGSHASERRPTASSPESLRALAWQPAGAILGGVDVKQRTRPTWRAFLGACALLGATGFGGGLAILAQAGDLFERRRWLTSREWVHTATVAQLLPGGAATNALAFAGLRFFGWAGALAGVLVYVAPSATVMIALGVFYGRLHRIPHLDAVLAGFNGAVVGLVIAVTWRLGQAGLRRGWQAILAAVALALERLGHATVLEVIVFGILMGLAADSVQKGLRLRGRRMARARGKAPGPLDDALADGQLDGNGSDGKMPVPPGGEGPPTEDPDHAGKTPPPPAPGNPSFLPFLLAAPKHDWLAEHWRALKLALGLSALGAPVALALLFTFARVGAVAYGGGFTIVPLIEREAVEQHRWITHAELGDAIALGQVTPGPVMICASFIGARAGGVMGGILATLGVFGVPAMLTVGLGVWIDRWRRTRAVKAALRGLVPAVVGMMAAAAFGLSSAGIHDEVGLILAAVSFAAVAQFKQNPAVVVLGAGAVRVTLLLVGGI